MAAGGIVLFSEGAVAATISQVVPVVGDVVAVATFLALFFDDLFGGNPSIPWEMHAPAHSPEGLVTVGWRDSVSQKSSSPPPDAEIRKPQSPELHRAPAPPSKSLSFPLCTADFLAFTAPSAIGCGLYGIACAGNALPACVVEAPFCLFEVAGIAGCYSQAHGGNFQTLVSLLRAGLSPKHPDLHLNQSKSGKAENFVVPKKAALVIVLGIAVIFAIQVWVVIGVPAWGLHSTLPFTPLRSVVMPVLLALAAGATAYSSKSERERRILYSVVFAGALEAVNIRIMIAFDQPLLMLVTFLLNAFMALQFVRYAFNKFFQESL